MRKKRNIILFYTFLQILYLPHNALAHTDITPLEAKELIDNNKNGSFVFKLKDVDSAVHNADEF
jgi:hypothetical protein